MFFVIGLGINNIKVYAKMRYEVTCMGIIVVVVGTSVSTLEQMQVPNGSGQGVRRSKRPLLNNRTHCNVLWKPLKIWL